MLNVTLLIVLFCLHILVKILHLYSNLTQTRTETDRLWELGKLNQKWMEFTLNLSDRITQMGSKMTNCISAISQVNSKPGV